MHVEFARDLLVAPPQTAQRRGELAPIRRIGRVLHREQQLAVDVSWVVAGKDDGEVRDGEEHDGWDGGDRAREDAGDVSVGGDDRVDRVCCNRHERTPDE